MQKHTTRLIRLVAPIILFTMSFILKYDSVIGQTSVRAKKSELEFHIRLFGYEMFRHQSHIFHVYDSVFFTHDYIESTSGKRPEILDFKVSYYRRDSLVSEFCNPGNSYSDSCKDFIKGHIYYIGSPYKAGIVALYHIRIRLGEKIATLRIRRRLE